MSEPPTTDAPGDPRAIAPWIASRTLDAELAALVWLLVGAGVPLVVAGRAGTGRAALRDAVGRLIPADTTRAVLAGEREDFAWLPEAVELGWHRERSDRPARQRTTGETVIVADLDDGPAGTWGERARIAIRALSVGYSMLATVRGDRLEDVFERLGGPPVEATEDELSRLGLVLVLDEGGRRVMAAHYLRPVARDAHGHTQRLQPAVVAALDGTNDRLEHFAWGIAPELADRIGVRPLELEREQARRAEILARAAEAPEATERSPDAG